MRSHPSCWNRTLAQLGFKRKRSKPNKRKSILPRRSLFENLEPRQLLAVDGPGLVAHWTFDESTGTTAVDTTSAQFDGILQGNSSWQPSAGAIGGAIEFDGDNDYVDISAAGTQIEGTANFAISGWVRASDTQPESTQDELYSAIVGVNTSNGGNRFLLMRLRSVGSDGHLRIHDQSLGGYQSSSTAQTGDGEWHHFAVTRSGNTVGLYVDGILQSEYETATVFSDTDIWSVGQEFDGADPTNDLNGSVDELRIYDRALSQTEISLLASESFAPQSHLDATTFSGGQEVQRTTYRGSIFGDDFVPINSETTYTFSAETKSGDSSGGQYDPLNRQYYGFASYDVDKLLIRPWHVLKHASAVDTRLTAPLNPGDQVVQLVDATGWQNGGADHTRSLAWYGYANSLGEVYDDYTYTRNVLYSNAWAADAIDYASNTITLNTPWAGPAVAANTAVRNAISGARHNYLLSYQSIPDQWTSLQYEFDGQNFRAGTAYIKSLMLTNWVNPSNTNLITWRNVTIGQVENIQGGQLVDLHVEPDTSGVPTTYQWKQIQGTSVDLQNANSITASFTAPFLSSEETLTFAVTATTSSGSLTDTVQVVIDPAELIVSTLTDEEDSDYSAGDFSLREALAEAANRPGPDIIVFASDLAGEIQLNGSQLTIDSDVSIVGPGDDLLTVNANSQSRVFDVGANNNVEISGITIANGRVDGSVGGGIRSNSDLTLDSVTVRNSTAVSNDSGGGGQGGGLYQQGAPLLVRNSTFEGNSARFGGGIRLLMTDSVNLPEVQILGSTFINNRAEQLNPNGSSTYSAGGGVFAHGAHGTTLITNSTFSGNSALHSGAVRGDGAAKIKVVNSTISKNHVTGSGGGIGGVGSSQITVQNSIVAGNTSDQGSHDVSFQSNILQQAESTHNIIGVNSGGQFGTSTNTIGVDPMLAPLGDYGGPTQTHALLIDSPAIDAGKFTLALLSSVGYFDQRGYNRFVDHNNGPGFMDIGAYEYGLVVTTADDENDTIYDRHDLSLREAIRVASEQSGSGLHQIEFAPSLAGSTIDLTGRLQIDSDVEILGLGADVLTIDANGTIDGPSKQVIFIEPDAKVTIEGVTITGGVNANFGGGIYNNRGDLTLRHVVVADNHVTQNGGAIYSFNGSLQILDSEIRGNSAGYSGGGVIAFSDGNDVLEVSGTKVIDNHALSGPGGGLYFRKRVEAGNAPVSLSITDSEILENTTTNAGGGLYLTHDSGDIGGVETVISNTIIANNQSGLNPDTSAFGAGIWSVAGDLTLSDVVLDGNNVDSESTSGAGAIYKSGGSLDITRSEIANNSGRFGAGIYFNMPDGERLSIVDSEIIGNAAKHAASATAAGGVYVDGAGSTPKGEVVISGTTFAYNISQDLNTGSSNDNHTGGLYLVDVADAEIINSTFSNNIADDAVGGIRVSNSGTVELINSTIAFNESRNSHSGGLYNQSGTVVANNTIVAGNTAGSGGWDVSGAFDGSSSYNLIGAVTDPGDTNNILLNGADPGLAPLGDYGGPTKTHALLPGSPAIEAGHYQVPFDRQIYTDQRGYFRFAANPEVVGGGSRIDIGAFELSEAVSFDATGFVGDFDGDHRPDELRFDLTTKSLNVVLNSASGPTVVKPWGQFNPDVNWLGNSLAVGDFDGDGRDDIIAFEYDTGLVSVAISDGTQFSVTESETAPIKSFSTLAGDFDGDGSDEMLAWDFQAARWNVLHYDRLSGFTLETNWGGTLNASGSLHVGDANRDGRDDLLSRSAGDTWRVALSQPSNTGSGIFTEVASDNAEWSTWFTGHYDDTSGKLAVDAPYQQVIDIFSEVYHNVELELYPGLMKGVTAAEQTKAGNPWDQAALLVDKLEAVLGELDNNNAADDKVRIVTGRVRVEKTELAKWLGLDDPDSAYDVISKSLDLLAEDETSHVVFTHAWVQAKVPTATGFGWVNLDPSWKFQERLPELVPASLEVTSGGNGTFDEFNYLLQGAEDAQLPLEYYEDVVQSYLSATTSYQGKSIADLRREGPIITRVFDTLSDGFGESVQLAALPNDYLDNFDAIVDNATDAALYTHRFQVSVNRTGDTGRDQSIPTNGSLGSYSPLDKPSTLPTIPVSFSSPSQFSSYNGLVATEGVSSSVYQVPLDGETLQPYGEDFSSIQDTVTNIDLSNVVAEDLAPYQGLDITSTPRVVYDQVITIPTGSPVPYQRYLQEGERFDVRHSLYRQAFTLSINDGGSAQIGFDSVLEFEVKVTERNHPLVFAATPYNHHYLQLDSRTQLAISPTNDGSASVFDQFTDGIPDADGYLHYRIPMSQLPSGYTSGSWTQISFIQEWNRQRITDYAGNPDVYSSGGSDTARYRNIKYYETLRADSVGFSSNQSAPAFRSVVLDGEQVFKTLDLDVSNHQITPYTKLQLTFSTGYGSSNTGLPSEGDAHYIGWDIDSTATQNESTAALYPVFGTTVSSNNLYDEYNSLGSDQILTIPVGTISTLSGGSAIDQEIGHLIFGVEDGISHYSEIKIIEDYPEGTANNNGSRILLEGNASRSIDIDNRFITRNTVLKFNFQSDKEGIAHSIGWDSNGTLGESDLENVNRAVYPIYGDVIDSSSLPPYMTYDGSGTDEIVIHIGDLSHGDNRTSAVGKLISYLTFETSGDDDVNSIFSNIRFEEQELLPLSGSLTVPSNDRVQLDGTIARRLTLPSTYTISPNTILQFNFDGEGREGALHRIGWDDNTSHSSGADSHKMYPIWGDDLEAEYAGYSSLFSNHVYDGSGNDLVEIPIGQIQGSENGLIRQLVFTAEADSHDVNARSIFSNIKLIEDVGDVGTHVQTPILAVPRYSLDDISVSYSVDSEGRYRANLAAGGPGDDNYFVAAAGGSKFFTAGDNVQVFLQRYLPTKLFPATLPSEDFTQTPGELVSIALEANQHSRESLAKKQKVLLDESASFLNQLQSSNITDPAQLTPPILRLLGYAGAKYWHDFNKGGDIVAGLTDTVGTQLDVGFGVVVAKPQLLVDGEGSQFIEHLTYGFAPVDMGVDLPGGRGGFLSRSTGGFDDEAFQLAGFQASALEHNVVEETINTESISTMKGLLNAFHGGQGLNRDHALLPDENSTTADAVLYFERSNGGSIYYRGDWNKYDDTVPNGSTVLTSSSATNVPALLNTLLANHAPKGGGVNEIAKSVWNWLFTSPNVRLFIPRGKSFVGNIDDISNPSNWIGSVYVAQEPSSGLYAIAKEGGTTTNGGFSGNLPSVVNPQLPVGNFTYSSYAGDPVNTANGSMFRDDVDISYPNLGVPLSFARHYDSQNEDDFGFGIGWVHSFSDRLIVDPDDASGQDLIWVTSSGQRHAFEHISGDNFEVPTALHGTFVKIGANYQYRDKSGMEYHFEPAAATGTRARLLRKVDRTGDGVELTYVSQDLIGQVRDVHDPLRRLQFAYQSSANLVSVTKYDNVDGVATPQGAWKYLIEQPAGLSDKYLTKVTHASDGTYISNSDPLKTTYSYYSSGINKGLMETITELHDNTSAGTALTHMYEYYPNGRVFRVIDSEGQVQTFNYNLFRNLTEFTDENGNTETYIHQDNGLTTRQIHADRTRQVFTWGDLETPKEFLMQSSTDEVGATETFEYYSNSSDFRYRELYRSTEKHFPNNSSPLTTEFDYSRPTNKQHIINIKSITVDPGSQDITTQFAYDSVGRLLTTTDALGNVTRRTYYQAGEGPTNSYDGLLKSETSPRGRDTSVSSSPNKEYVPWEILDPSFNITGNTLSVQVSFANFTAGQKIVADAIRIDRVNNGDYPFSRVLDDDNNNLNNEFHSSAGSNGINYGGGHSVYYNSDRVLLDASGETATWTFNGLEPGNYRVSATWNGNTVLSDQVHYKIVAGTFFGSATPILKNQKIAPNDFGAGKGNPATFEFTTTFQYDAAGNVTAAMTDGLPTTENTYDSHGNLLTSSNPDGVENHFTYDVLGRLQETQLIPNNQSQPASVTQSEYDSNGRLSLTIDPLGRETRYEYDSKGNLVKQIFADGTSVTSEYDNLENSNLISQTDQLGRTTRFIYDSQNRLIETIHPDGAVERVRFNGRGQVSASIDALGNETKFAYDAAGRIFVTRDAAGNLTNNSYNALGQLFYQQDSNGNVTLFAYDKLGRTIKSGTWSVSEQKVLSLQTSDFDAAGNLIQSAIFDTVGLAESGNPVGLWDLSSDRRDLITPQNQLDNLVQVTETRYDSLNRPIETIVAVGTDDQAYTRLVYDNSGRVQFSYDELGRKTQQYYDSYGRQVVTILPDPDFSSGGQAAPLTIFLYDLAGNQTTVIDPRNNKTEFEYDVFNRPVTVTDAEGNQTHTVYDTAGQLVATVDALGRSAYTLYDERGRAELTRSPDPDGSGPLLAPETQFRYDAASNLVEQIDPQGIRTTFEYDELNRLVREEIEVDELSVSVGASNYGIAVSDTATGFGYIMYTETPVSQRFTPSPHADNAEHLIAVRFQAGSWKYNDNDPTESQSWVEFAPESTDVLLASINFGSGSTTADNTVTSLEGINTVFEGVRLGYASGNLTFTPNEWNGLQDGTAQGEFGVAGTFFTLGSATTTAVNAYTFGRSYTYDANGNLLSETDTLGRITDYTYDALNRVKTVTLPDPDGDGSLPRPLTTTNYDGYGNVTTSVEDRGGGTNQRTTKWTYDHHNRVEFETLDEGGNEEVTTAYSYDKVGNLTQLREAFGSLDIDTTYQYDNLNRRTAERKDPGDGTALITAFTYDATGNLTGTTDYVWTFSPYSPYSLLITQTDFSYDKLGRQISITNDFGGTLESTTTFEYDGVGNLLRTTDPLGRVSESKYDRHNRLIESIAADPDGVGPLDSPITTFTYDLVGNLVAQTNPEGETERFIYDTLGRLVRSYDALGAESRSRYDSEGNLLEFTDPNDNVTVYEYDDLNRLEFETISLPTIGDVSRNYTYNAQGNLDKIVDRNGRVRSFQYDRLDRQTLEFWQDTPTTYTTHIQTWQYDELGRIERTQDSSTTTTRVETFEYDNLGRITKQRNYDPNNLTRTTAPKIEQRYDYDVLNVLNSAGPGELVQTLYSQYSTSNDVDFIEIGSTAYFTDQLGRTAKIDDAANVTNDIVDKQIEFTYDLAGQMLATTRTADGGNFHFDTNYTYDDLGRVRAIHHLRPTASSSPFTSYAYQYDQASRIIEQSTGHDTSMAALSQLAADETVLHSFDLAGQLTGSLGSSTGDEDYAYDENGNRTSGGTIVDAHNRLIEDDNYTYTYDNEGNLSRRDAKNSNHYTEYTWDHRNRLVQVTDSNIPEIIGVNKSYFTYNASDELTYRANDYHFQGGIITGREKDHYVYSGGQRVLALDPNGDIHHRYLWGTGTDHLIVDEVFDGAGQVEESLWAVNDHMGSVNSLLDISGTVVEHREYDSFGNLTAAFDETGASKNLRTLDSAFAYAGRRWDEDARLYYNRARWYEPESGRFISVDPIEEGANWYAYAGNDPLNFRDPSGLSQAGNPLNALAGGFAGNVVSGISNFFTDPGQTFFNVGQGLGQFNNTPVGGLVSSGVSTLASTFGGLGGASTRELSTNLPQGTFHLDTLQRLETQNIPSLINTVRCVACHNPIIANGGSIRDLPLSHQIAAMRFARVDTPERVDGVNGVLKGLNRITFETTMFVGTAGAGNVALAGKSGLQLTGALARNGVLNGGRFAAISESAGFALEGEVPSLERFATKTAIAGTIDIGFSAAFNSIASRTATTTATNLSNPILTNGSRTSLNPALFDFTTPIATSPPPLLIQNGVVGFTRVRSANPTVSGSRTTVSSDLLTVPNRLQNKLAAWRRYDGDLSLEQWSRRYGQLQVNRARSAWAESFGEPGARYSTPYGARIVDNAPAIEIKTGYQSATKFVRRQIIKDSYLRRTIDGYNPVWRFIDRTPSRPLIDKLDTFGIPYELPTR